MAMRTRNTTTSRFKSLCITCRHFYCVKERGGDKYCTVKGRPVGNGVKCSKFKDAQMKLDL